MWIQAIAIILPRVQQHYSGELPSSHLVVSDFNEPKTLFLHRLLAVPDSYIGLVSSSMFGGMMIGAIGWGTCTSSAPFFHVRRARLTLFNRLRPHGSNYGLQRNPLLHSRLRHPRVLRQLVLDPLCDFIPSGKFRWGMYPLVSRCPSLITRSN